MKAFLLASTLAALGAQEGAINLKVGDPAPGFQAPDDAGQAWNSSEHVGKKVVVVYFFPAAFTGG